MQEHVGLPGCCSEHLTASTGRKSTGTALLTGNFQSILPLLKAQSLFATAWV